MTYSFKDISNHDLKVKIRRAYFWLLAHESPLNKEGWGWKIGVAGNKWNHYPQEYNQNLKFYEQAVDEARRRGIEEKDCWSYEDNTITINNMTTEEYLLA